MRKIIFNMLTGAGILLALIIFVSSCSKSNTPGKIITATPPVDTTHKKDPVTYSLIWSDEFDSTAVKTKNWNFETGNLGVNNEKEYYQAANATIEAGNLVITAKRENVGGQLYTSARLNSQGKVTATYGRIEARIKAPLGAGFWPAFWMLGSNITTVNWPNCGEIDIMEHVNADNLFYGTIHWNSGGGHAQYGLNTTIATAGDYHVYAIEWDNSEIRWYVDSTQYVTANIANNINNTGAFHLPFFILLNFAVGGDFPNQPIDDSLLPAKMYVDYVRVYKGN